jgi:hypothetical protein
MTCRVGIALIHQERSHSIAKLKVADVRLGAHSVTRTSATSRSAVKLKEKRLNRCISETAQARVNQYTIPE